MMFCAACSARTSLVFDVDAPARRMKVCAACYQAFRAGQPLAPARVHGHGHRPRWGARQAELPVFGDGREVPEAFR